MDVFIPNFISSNMTSIIYIFKLNQDNEDVRLYINSFIYDHHSYSIKFINRANEALSAEELERIVNSVKF